MQRLKWIERDFKFDYPPTMAAVFIARLRGSIPQIYHVVNTCSDEQLSYKPAGKWSVKEEIGHLHDLEELHMGRLKDFRDKVNILRPADMSNKKTENANHNSMSGATLAELFESSRQILLKEIMEFDEKDFAHAILHPRLNKPMRLVDVFYFTAEHDDHHITNMYDILGY